MYLRGIRIKGFKKYIDYTVKFKEHLNILIGENEAGKSTILEAIEVALNQKYFGRNDNANGLFFSKDNIDKFKKEKILEFLPKIEIEIFFSPLENEKATPAIGRFYGEHNSYLKAYFGIRFSYEFDNSYSNLFNNISECPTIPIDYYKAKWTTFSGASYNKRLNPLKSLTIDNSISRYGIYDSFAKDLFERTYREEKQNQLSFDFRAIIKDYLGNKSEDLKLDKEHNFSISEDKTNIKSLLTLEHQGIVLQQKGKGLENIIKTHQAIKNSESKLLMIEEPENHLSPSNLRKLISDISNSNKDSQIILTTHESMIVNRLGLDKLIWLEKEQPNRFENLKNDTIQYFSKIDHTNILQFILADKVILVEGAAEYILMDLMLRSVENEAKGLDDYKIEVISGGGITYKYYLDVAKDLNKPILVVTDNDGYKSKIDDSAKENHDYETESRPILIKMDDDLNNTTFEISLFNKNKDLFKNFARANATDKYKGKEYDKNLAYMLNNKTKSALRIEMEFSAKDINCPDYISEGLKWLIKQ